MIDKIINVLPELYFWVEAQTHGNRPRPSLVVPRCNCTRYQWTCTSHLWLLQRNPTGRTPSKHHNSQLRNIVDILTSSCKSPAKARAVLGIRPHTHNLSSDTLGLFSISEIQINEHINFTRIKTHLEKFSKLPAVRSEWEQKDLSLQNCQLVWIRCCKSLLIIRMISLDFSLHKT